MELFSARVAGADQPGNNQEHRRYYQEWLWVVTLALSGVALFTLMHWGTVAGLVVYDQFHRWRAPSPANDIVVIAVDDASLDALGGWPLKRTVYADLLQKLADTDNLPAAVGVDVFFRDVRPEDGALARQMRRHRVYLAVEQAPQHGESAVESLSPELADAAQGLAHVNLTFESDGFLRGVRLFQGGMPQLALAMSGRGVEAFSARDGYRRFDLVDPEMGFPLVSLGDVLSGDFPLDLLKDKYVLLGAVAPSLGDHYPTIYSGQEGAGMPGVLLHANALNALLRDNLISPISLGWQLGLSWLAVSLALLALLALSPLAEIWFSVGLVVGTLSLSFWLLVAHNLWFDPAVALCIMVLLKPVWVWRRNGMVVRFLMDRVSQLKPYQRSGTPVSAAQGLRRFTSDTVFQYSRVLDGLIRDASARLGFLNAVLQESPSAMLVVDASDGRIVMRNARALECMPAQLSEVGQTLSALWMHWGLDTHTDLTQLTGAGQSVSAPDTQARRRHCKLRAAQLPPSADQDWWLLSWVDVTEMHEFQAQRDRTLQLLSHDMRTPLASIMVLGREARQGALPHVETSSRIVRNASTVLRMMDDFILAIQADATQYKLQETLLEEMVDEAVYQVRDWAQSRQMFWRVEVGTEPLFILADPRLWVRMLVNLLTNAVRHGQAQTEIRIDLTLESSTAQAPQGWVQLRLSNTVGSPENETSLPLFKGFGLGLEFVQTVVSKHQGEMSMDIPAYTGTQATVVCRFPRSTPKALP